MADRTARAGRGRSRWRPVGLGVLLAVGAGFLLWACDRSAPEGAGIWEASESARSGPRLVSLSPAVTQWLDALGLRDAVVGVGDGDEMVRPGVPSVGTFADIDLERLAVLEPTAVLAMTDPAKLPASLTAAAKERGFSLNARPYPATLAEALKMGRFVGDAVGRADAAEALVEGVGARLDAVARATAGPPAVRTLLVFSTQPLQACGAGTVHDELLTIAGGVNVCDEALGSAPTLDAELLTDLAPEVVLVLRPRAGSADLQAGALAGLDAKVVHLDDPAILLAGPGMDLTAVSMAVALHPERALAVAQAFAEFSGLPLEDAGGR